MDTADTEMCMICSDLAKSPDLNSTLKVLARNITKVMGGKGCSIRLLDEKNHGRHFSSRLPPQLKKCFATGG